MDILGEFGVTVWVLALAITVAAGFVKGAVGFAMPMIMISGLSSIMDPELALAGLILPTLLTNLIQALRSGIASARRAIAHHRRYILALLVMVALSAQLVRSLPDTALYLILGVPITGFALIQLFGVRLRLADRGRRAAEIGIGAFAGFFGGISGVWGPPTVLYLTALDTPKSEQMQVQGLVYGCGAVVLTAAHINSGIFNLSTAPLSAALLVPALAGAFVGFSVSDRLDQARFRRLTLAVLVVAGLNLVRRGLMG